MDRTEPCSSPQDVFPIVSKNTMGTPAFAPIRESKVSKPKASVIEGSFLATQFGSISHNDSVDRNGCDIERRDTVEKESRHETVQLQENPPSSNTESDVSVKDAARDGEIFQDRMVDSGVTLA